MLRGSKVRLTVGSIAPLLLLALAVTASADQGGATISSAPELPLGQQVTSTVSSSVKLAKVCTAQGLSGEFWRVSMRTQDQLVVDFASANGDQVGINMLTPTVTDETMGDAETTGQCLNFESTSAKGEMQFQAAGGGRYTMLVSHRQGSQALSYTFTARVLHSTAATIAAPSKVKAGGKVTYRGRISGASGGSATLRLRTSTHPAWKNIAVVKLGPTGAFTFKTRVAAAGTYTVRVIYRGDESHLPSSATASFRVS